MLKRFISEDPIGMLAGPNFYQYVSGAPILFNDAFGLQRSGGSSIGRKLLETLTKPRDDLPTGAGVDASQLPAGAGMEQKGAEYGQSLCKSGTRDYVTDCIEYCVGLTTAGTGGPGAGGDIGACTAKCQSAYTKCKYPPQSSCPVPNMF